MSVLWSYPLIFESCGTVDGPGIRFIVVFLPRMPNEMPSIVTTVTIWDTHGGQIVTVDELLKEAVTYRHFYECLWWWRYCFWW